MFFVKLRRLKKIQTLDDGRRWCCVSIGSNGGRSSKSKTSCCVNKATNPLLTVAGEAVELLDFRPFLLEAAAAVLLSLKISTTFFLAKASFMAFFLEGLLLGLLSGSPKLGNGVHFSNLFKTHPVSLSGRKGFRKTCSSKALRASLDSNFTVPQEKPK